MRTATESTWKRTWAKAAGSEGEGRDVTWLSRVCVITVCESWKAAAQPFWLHQGG